MQIKLGKLTEKSLYKDEKELALFQAFLKEKGITRQNNIDMARADKCFHIFDMPRQVCAGNMETVKTLLTFFEKHQPDGQWQLTHF